MDKTDAIKNINSEISISRTTALAYVVSSKQFYHQLVGNRMKVVTSFTERIQQTNKNLEIQKEELKLIGNNVKTEDDITKKYELLMKLREMCQFKKSLETLLNELTEENKKLDKNRERRIFERKDTIVEFQNRINDEQIELPKRINRMEKETFNQNQQECLSIHEKALENLTELNASVAKLENDFKSKSNEIEQINSVASAPLEVTLILKQKVWSKQKKQHELQLGQIRGHLAAGRLELIREVDRLKSIETDQLENLRNLDARLDDLTTRTKNLEKNIGKMKKVSNSNRASIGKISQSEKILTKRIMLMQTQTGRTLKQMTDFMQIVDVD